MPVRSVFKWPGGKRRIMKQLLPLFPKNIPHYVEPFLGGGTVFLHLLPENAVLSDNNEELINAYLQIKNRPRELLSRLRDFDVNTKEFFLRMRAWKPTDPVDRAARTIYLNKTSFNGLWRVNRKGEFNAPFGNRKNPNIVDEEAILSMHEALKFAHVFHADFRETLLHAGKDSFVYLDPPYYKTSEESFSRFTKERFSDKDHMDLYLWCRKLDAMGCKFMYNNSAHEDIVKLFSEFNIKFIRGYTSVCGYKKSRYPTREIVVTNYDH